MNTVERAPAFIAAEAGYDVWLGNIRGNKHSRAHVSLDPDGHDGAFWQYSFAENGLIDVKSMIEYVKMETGVDKIAYVGHSMGTTMMYYLAVKDPDFVKDSVSIAI